MEFGTSYANRADDGAPYVGPVILADSIATAVALCATHLRGPNGEPLTVIGEIVQRLAPDIHGDTKQWMRRVVTSVDLEWE